MRWAVCRLLWYSKVIDNGQRNTDRRALRPFVCRHLPILIGLISPATTTKLLVGSFQYLGRNHLTDSFLIKSKFPAPDCPCHSKKFFLTPLHNSCLNNYHTLQYGFLYYMNDRNSMQIVVICYLKLRSCLYCPVSSKTWSHRAVLRFSFQYGKRSGPFFVSCLGKILIWKE